MKRRIREHKRKIMFREMRRKNQLLEQKEALKILETSTSGVLSLLGDNGYPYGVPLSFVYYENKIYENDPFARLDQVGVGKLVKMAAELGRATRPDIKLGICGEHGGDPSTIEFCHNVGLNYVSCSPFRVPIARLAAAQAAIREQR